LQEERRIKNKKRKKILMDLRMKLIKERRGEEDSAMRRNKRIRKLQLERGKAKIVKENYDTVVYINVMAVFSREKWWF
jgi:hypothetical protein